MIELLKKYTAGTEETAFIPRFLTLLDDLPRCLYRDFFVPGHITGSGLLISADHTRVLLNHHKSLNRWLCFGGHADGNADIEDVARRELAEEAGVTDTILLPGGIHDLDIHGIPANPAKNEPAHEHFDIRFFFRARNDDFVISDESVRLQWCTFDEALTYVTTPGMRRLIQKARDWK